MLDSLELTDGMYLEDDGNLHYKAYNHEMTREELRIKSTKSVNIKFNKKYSTEREIECIVFSDIIMDFEEYEKSENKEEYSNRQEISIKM